ncbi:MAG: Gfo/Idh/MocA family oxidoreductase [Candidatus Kapabacteria bacterium]|nr:Gfo/Idh/MocA family oxidoreductase [Candidatus Kapabacteria bacterium]
MKYTGIGIIGAGEMAQNFHLPILQNLQDVKILSICDRLLSKANIIAEKFNIPYVCESLSEMLAIEELEAVFILTPTDLHSKFALECIKSKKHIFIEKPIAKNYEDAKLISDSAELNKVKCMIGMSQRFRQDAKMMKYYVQNGDLGEVFYIKAGWAQKKHNQIWKDNKDKSGGGVLMDLGLSLIDSILWVFNYQEVKSVVANNFSRTNSDMEDISVGTILFKNGAVATLECSWSLFTSMTNYYFNVYGQEGSAMVNPLQLYKRNGDLLQPQANTDKINNLNLHKKSYESEIKHFINAVRGLGPVISSANEALEAIRVLDAFYISSNEKREVFL